MLWEAPVQELGVVFCADPFIGAVNPGTRYRRVHEGGRGPHGQGQRLEISGMERKSWADYFDPLIGCVENKSRREGWKGKPDQGWSHRP